MEVSDFKIFLNIHPCLLFHSFPFYYTFEVIIIITMIIIVTITGVIKLSRVCDFGSFYEVQNSRILISMIDSAHIREILKFVNLFNFRYSRKLKPREYYQFHSRYE